MFFREVFQPVLESEFPGVLTKLKPGVVGGGSDSLGTDDELSRDHDWGVGRCRLCLPEDEAADKGRAISEALSAAVPEGYLGLPRNVHSEGLLPDAKPRHAMGAFDLIGSIESEEIKDIGRELDPNLGPDL